MKITTDTVFRKQILEEFEKFIQYHQSIPSSRISFNNAKQEIETLMPLDKDPIFPKP